MSKKQFKIEYISGNRAWSFCPYHNDKYRPNLSISLDKEYYGRWKCWACGKYGKLSNKEMEHLNLDNYKEYQTSTKMSTVWSDLVDSYHKSLVSMPLIVECLVKELNLKSECLVNYWNLGYDGQGITIPMYKNNEVVGIQRRFPNREKCCMIGSQLGIFKEHDYEGCEDTLFICEGFSDTIALNDLYFMSIGRPHCHFIDVVDYFDFTFFNKIVIVPDNDEVGVTGARKLSDELNRYLSDTIVDIVSVKEYCGCKDIRDVVRVKGREYATSLLEYYTNE